MKTIYVEDYISNHEEALSVITDFTKNKLIIKGSTGIGGTSAILSITNQTVIIISPYLGMIQGKQEQITKENKFFIYQNSTSRWHDIEWMLSEGQQFILNTTPDQILYIQKHKPALFERVKKIPLFIDECHIAAEAEYRKALAEFNHIVCNHWENNFTLSTATPVYRNLDIPPIILETFEVVQIQRKDEPLKDIFIYNYEYFFNWVYQEIEQERKVVVFTNDKNIYKRFSQDDTLKTQELVGAHLEKEVATYRDNSEKPLSSKIDLDNDLYILSTKYITGFDIPFNASVAIIANEKCPTDTRYINDIVQAYGRVRKTVLNAGIFYSRNEYTETITDEEFLKNFNHALANPKAQHLTNGKVNHTMVLSECLPTLMRRETYNSVETLAENLKPFGFNPIIVAEDIEKIHSANVILHEKIRNLKTLDLNLLKRYAEYVFNNINGDNENYNGYTEKLILTYVAAIISKTCNNQWLDNKLDKIERYSDLVSTLKTFIDTNIQSLGQMGIKSTQLEKKWYETNLEPNEFDSIARFSVSERIIRNAKKDGALSDEFHVSNSPYNLFNNCIYLVNTFHAINLVQQDKVDEETLQAMEIQSKISEVMKADYLYGVSKTLDIPVYKILKLIDENDKGLNDKMYNRHIKSFFKHSLNKVIRNLTFEPTPQQIEGIELKIEKYKNTLNKTKDDKTSDSIRFKLNLIDYSIVKQKEYHRYYLLGMASLHNAGHTAGFRCSKANNREYNVATKVPRALRYKYTPYQMVEVDIASTNPQIIDQIFGTNIGMDVYMNLMNSHGISRDKAKVLFNRTINNQNLSIEKAKEIYLSAGYSMHDAEILANKTTSTKIYNEMCVEEEYLIDTYKAVTKVQNAIRIHDALLMLAIPHNTNNLPEEINGTRFKVVYY